MQVWPQPGDKKVKMAKNGEIIGYGPGTLLQIKGSGNKTAKGVVKPMFTTNELNENNKSIEDRS